MQIRAKVKIGNGQQTSFWHDKWTGQGTMKQQHPELFALSQQQHTTVSMMWTGQAWNLFLRRHLNDWETKRIAEFYNSTDWNDKDRNGKFSINSAYKELNSAVVKGKDWPWKMIRKPKIPYKVS
ncbi:hypothetical protein H5410_020583 [Solanum commersonii]|uniref:Uncharacterized protein n=1 Tax=Solanum commersonii TaxID=4109 RepID=A0A9J5ZEM6_SOLCO|nr:hypothetical protein H5410_020583 [Solanum commersonii]